MADSNTLFSIDFRSLLLIVQGLIMCIFLVLGWIAKYILNKIDQRLKELEDKVSKQTEDTSALNVMLPTNYVAKLEFSKTMDALFERLEKTNESINNTRDALTNKIDAMMQTVYSKQISNDKGDNNV